MKHNSHQFHCGLKDGVPIGLGYLAVSFTFGIMARGAGLTTLQSVVMSFTNLTATGKQARLGSRFASLKGQGHGFGLQRVDAAVERLGGYITRNSEDGAFTTEVLLPQ